MAFPSSAILDNFNRASLGANWTTAFLDGTALTNPNGTQLPGLSGFADGYYNPLGGLNGGTVEVFITVATIQAGAGNESVMTYFVDASKNGYAIEWDATTARIYRIDAGAQTLLGANVSFTLANGDVVGLKFTPGGTIEAYQNGTQIGSRSEATYSTMDRIGIESGNSTTIRLDDFGGGIAGSLTAAGGNTLRPSVPFMSNGRI